jgi:hypothetical protein
VNSPGRDGKRDRSVSNVRNGAVTFAIAALILLSPVIAFLIVSTAEMLIDVVIEARAIAICGVSAGAIGWTLFRKNRPRLKVALQSRQEQVCDEAAIAASRT